MHFSITGNPSKYYNKNNPQKNNQQSLINCLDKENVNPQNTFVREPRRRNIGMVHNIVSVTYHDANAHSSQYLESLLFGSGKKSSRGDSQEDDLLLSDYVELGTANELEELGYTYLVKRGEGYHDFAIVSPPYKPTEEDHGNLWKRLKCAFRSDINPLDFFLSICESIDQGALQLSMRAFLFENNIIFNKAELKQLTQVIRCPCYSPSDLGSKLEALFFHSTQKQSQQFMILDYRIGQIFSTAAHNIWDVIYALKDEEKEIKHLKEWALLFTS